MNVRSQRSRRVDRRRIVSVGTCSSVVLIIAVGLLVASTVRSIDEENSRSSATTELPAFHLLVFGGSTAAGEPYDPHVDLGRIVSWRFGGRLRGRPIRVCNFAGRGKNAGATLRDVQRAIGLGFDPTYTAALLYLGNNEFLAFDTGHDLSRAQRRLFDVPAVTDAQRAQVLRNYGRTIDEILRLLQQARIPVIASTIAVNQKDWDPNRSVLGDPANEAFVREALDTGERLWEANDVTGALAAFQKIVRQEPSFALARKRSGDCRRRLGHTVEARDDYQRAIDADGLPTRETSEQDRILREFCQRRRVPLVDAARLLADASPDGLIGFEFLWDNCHPTLAGYSLIADGFVAPIQALYGEQSTNEAASVEPLERVFGINREIRKRVLVSRGQYCYVLSTLVWNPVARLQRAALYLDQAQALAPDDADVVCSRAIVAALSGHGDESVALWRDAHARAARIACQRAAHPYVRQIMSRCGQPDFETKMRE